MLTDLRWLALEVKDLDRAREFYEDSFYLDATERGRDEVALDVGGDGTDLLLRRPTGRPRGGLHTHYALSIPGAEYDRWYDGLSESMTVEEHDFGGMRSLYVYDPDGNCVELADDDVAGPGVDGVFEVVLEVADLDRAEEFYTALGFVPVDREGDRVRLSGPTDLELWEPRLGIANARGGVHVDLGFEAEDVDRVGEALEDRARVREEIDGGIRFYDPDGHALTFR